SPHNPPASRPDHRRRRRLVIQGNLSIEIIAEPSNCKLLSSVAHDIRQVFLEPRFWSACPTPRSRSFLIFQPSTPWNDRTGCDRLSAESLPAASPAIDRLWTR